MSVRYQVGPEETLLYSTTFYRSKPSTLLLIIGHARLIKPYARGYLLFSVRKNGFLYAQARQTNTGEVQLIICTEELPTMENMYKLTAQLVGARRPVWVEDPRVTVIETKEKK